MRDNEEAKAVLDYTQSSNLASFVHLGCHAYSTDNFLAEIIASSPFSQPYPYSAGGGLLLNMTSQLESNQRVRSHYESSIIVFKIFDNAIKVIVCVSLVATPKRETISHLQ